MITTACEQLALFDSLPQTERHDFVVAVLRRTMSDTGLSDEMLVQLAEEVVEATEKSN